jgi:hypothetical protein
LQAYIAQLTGLLAIDGFELEWLARWLVAAILWPDFVDNMRLNQSFDNELREASSLRDQIRQPSITEDDKKQAQADLDRLLEKPYVKRLLDAPGLRDFVDETVLLDDTAVQHYLYLASSTLGATSVV